MERSHPELGWLWDQPETMLPVLETPDCFDIAVVGASAGRGAFFWGPVSLLQIQLKDISVVLI
jgi:hypothetical protein